MKVIYALMTVALLPGLMGSLWAQSRRLGAVPEDSIYQKVPLAPERTYGKDFYFPQKCSLKKYCPPAGDQGPYASCVGWASSYALSISLAWRSRIDFYTPHLLSKLQVSALYIYNQIKLGGDCNYGARTSDAMLLLKTQGDCRLKLFSNDSPCNRLPNQVEKTDALFFRISDYWRVFNVDSRADEKIDLTKKMLLENKPLVVAVEVTSSFMDNQSGFWYPKGDDKIGLHTMVVVGYDGQYFELLNSFGASWGDAGYIKVSHQDYAKYARYAYIMCLDNDWQCQAEDKSTAALHINPLFGRFSLIQVLEDTTMIVPTQYEHEDKMFTVNPDYDKNLLFQLEAHDLFPGMNLYLFVENADGATVFLDEIRSFQPETDGKPVLIPGANQLFDFEKGDAFYVILSHEVIPDFRSRVASFSDCSGTALEKLRCAFSSQLLGEANIMRLADEPGLVYIPQPEQKGIASLVFKFE